MVTVALCGTTASVPMIALALQLSPAGLVAVWFARGVAIGVLSAVWDATLQLRIAPESMARVSSWDWMTAGGLWPLGLVLAGPIAQLMGVTDTLWLSAALGIVSLALGPARQGRVAAAGAARGGDRLDAGGA